MRPDFRWRSMFLYLLYGTPSGMIQLMSLLWGGAAMASRAVDPAP